MKCDQCGVEQYEDLILPQHDENVGGVKVRLIEAAHVRRCPSCGDEQIMVPDMLGLVRAVVLARATHPLVLGACDVKLMRRALDMNQKQFAKAVGVSPEVISRWETGAKGIGAFADKLVRQQACALIQEMAPLMEYDAAQIARLETRMPIREDECLSFVFQRVVVKNDGHKARVWDAQLPEAA